MRKNWAAFRGWPTRLQVLSWLFVVLLAIGLVSSALGVGATPSSNAAGGSATSTDASSHSTATTAERHPVPGQPDPLHPSAALTPGATFAGVTKDQVCVAGYSASVRSVSDSTRDQVFAEYNLASANRGDYEVDHLISLELGGSNDIKNLWPQPLHDSGHDDAVDKDELENQLHSLVCNGEVSLTDAQTAIVHWDTVQLASLVSTTTTSTLPPTTRPPATSPPATEPAVTPGNGATALCNDGTYSYAAHHQGACSHHGGVAVFYK